MDGNSAAATMS